MAAATAEVRPVRREERSALLASFFDIAEKWKLSAEEQMKLLGSPSRSTFYKWRKEGGLPPQDTLDRISYILGIYKALHILFSDDNRADEWVRRPNNASMFGGMTALQFMLRDGRMVDLFKVRQYLDAQRGGWS